jgi:diguanylate cyclase (GGDEF)-like protein
MVDIDRFKALNDTHGHAVGDEVLRSVAGAIAGAVREDDVPARYGGEEFAVVLRNPSRDEAVEVGERIREAVASLDLRRMGVISTSVSVGVAVADEPGRLIPEVIERADQALFEAKRKGRDRVIAA